MQQHLQNPEAAGKLSGLPLTFIFEGKTYEWQEQYISESQFRLLTRSEKRTGELFLEICEPWEDERITEHNPVNLARPGIEQFYFRHPLHYTINGVKFESNSQYIRGKRIRHQGGIPNDNDIFLVIEDPWEDELINDDTWINLARPGRENFISRPSDISVTLIINSRPRPWSRRKITFEEVVILQYGQYDPNPLISYSVTYKNGPKENPEGIMSPGEILFVKNKMNFHVSRTNQS